MNDDLPNSPEQRNQKLVPPGLEDIPPPDDGDAPTVIPSPSLKSNVEETSSEDQSDKGPSKYDIYRTVTRLMLREYVPRPWKEFPHIFMVLKDQRGIRYYIEVGDQQVVRHIDQQEIYCAVQRYLEEDCQHLKGYYVEKGGLGEIMGLWNSRARAIQPNAIRPVLQKDTNGMTYHRLPWNIAKGSTPLFDELMGRTSNAAALMAFIGSVFVEESDMQQYCVLYGDGDNGKSTLAELLKKCLGPAAHAETVPDKTDKFWLANFEGKRLAQFNDCTKMNFVTSGAFKALTGGDHQKIEHKGKPAYSAKLIAKCMFTTNKRPAISSMKADLKRIMLHEIAPLPPDVKPNKKYEKELWKEAPHILAKCLAKYKELCPDHGRIPMDESDESLKDWVSTVEEDFESAWEANFVKVSSPLAYMLPRAMSDRLNKLFPDKRKQNDFREWMERTHGIKKKTMNAVPGAPKGYQGVGLVYMGHEINTAEIEQKALQGKWGKDHLKAAPAVKPD